MNNIIKSNFQFGTLPFNWGENIDDLKHTLKTLNPSGPIIVKSSDTLLKLKTKEIWGIKVNSIELTSPHPDRIINLIKINLGYFNKDKAKLIQSLEIFFEQKSTPAQSSPYLNIDFYDVWEYSNCTITLCIYGSKDISPEEDNYGSIEILLTDLNMLNELYCSPAYKKTYNLSEFDSGNENPEHHIFHMDRPQTSYWASLQLNYPKYELEYISETLNCFYKKDFLKTPKKIQSILSENKIAVFKDSATSDFYLANYWETIKLKNTKNISWTNCKSPGPSYKGYCTIAIEEFKITNEPSQHETKLLIKKIEKIIKTKINCVQEFYSFPC